MRIKRLDLKAFGPFTDQTLEFDSSDPGLHIIFGPNEAGKSSALRALKALLYGFPQQTPDNFIHNYDQLLVGGCLEGTDGRELSFLRRKKRKADLLDPDGNILDPGVLALFLHGIDPALFESLYGIDHKILVQGGEDILAQKGEIGQALFAAGAGISTLKKILDSLDDEADDLFKARGSKQLINQAVKQYKELKKLVKDTSLRSSRWKEHRKRLAEAEAELAGLEEKKKQKNAELQRLERLNRAIPVLAELENLKKQFHQLGDVVVLPPGFPEQLQEVKQNIRETRLQFDDYREHLRKLLGRQDEISLNQPLLDHADTIEDLHQRLGEYRKGVKDRIKLDGMRITHHKEAGTLLEGIRPGLKLAEAESLKPLMGKKRTIQDLSSQYESIKTKAAQAKKQQQESAAELELIENALSALPPVQERDGLSKAIKTALRIGDIDQQINDLTSQIDTGKKLCQTELKKAGLWSGELAQLFEAPLPLAETARRYDTLFSEIETQSRQLEKDHNKSKDDLKTATTDYKEMIYGGEVPTEQNLVESRRKRQQGWQLLRRQWIDGQDISTEAEQYDPAHPVHDAYERHVDQSDRIADRLRREAERVAKTASLRARIENIEETIQEIISQEQKLHERRKITLDDWRGEWRPVGIKPLSPKEMLSWLTDIETLRIKINEVTNKENDVAAKDSARQQYRQLLIEELTSSGENNQFTGNDLASVLAFAESLLEDIDNNTTELEKLNTDKVKAKSALDRAGNELKEAETEKNEWQEKWSTALACLKLEDQPLPSEALDILENLDNCFDKLEKADDLQARINGIDRDVSKFAADVEMLLEQVAPELKTLPPDQAVLQLHTMLGKARQNSELLKKNKEDADTLSVKIQTADKTLQALDKQMTELLATARCDQETDLAEVIRKSSEYLRLQEKISDAETAMAKACEGVPFEEIKRQADEADVDELPGLLDALRRRIDEDLQQLIKDISQVIGEEKNELKLMDGSAKAAEAAEELERVAAKIRRLVDQYTRIKLAAMMLKNEIERYREEHQDPMLQIASDIFSRLTIGSFAGLRSDVNDNGDPILVGVRPDDTRVKVEGMSDGTCDQLYLALRLATLQWRLETSEPMPFIVDDILINFDDDRSRATLQALAELSEKNQVVLFTHHQKIVDEAQSLADNDSVHVHTL